MPTFGIFASSFKYRREMIASGGQGLFTIYFDIKRYADMILGSSLPGAPTGNQSARGFASTGYPEGATTNDNYFFAALGAAPRIAAWRWTQNTISVQVTSPATLPTGQGNNVVINSSLNQVAVAHATSPFVSVYPWTGTAWGVKYANPSPLPTGNGNDLQFRTTDNALAIAHSTSPFVTAYAWSSGGFGTKYADPSPSLPGGSSGQGNGVAFSPDGANIAIAHISSPYITAYTWTPGFGTKYADPATPITSDGTAVRFHIHNNAIFVGSTSTSTTHAYGWTPGVGFGTKFADPVSITTAAVRQIDVNYDGTAIAVATSTAFVYAWSNGFGERITNNLNFNSTKFF